MDMPINHFKQQLAEPGNTYGIIVSLADPVAAEITANAGFDWIIVDTEHAPNDLRTVMSQMQSTAASDCNVIVRPMSTDRVTIKRLLDIGAQSLLVPMVDDAAEATHVVESIRYPPLGKRGVAGGRAAGWGQVEGYFTKADDQMCLIVQIESVTALANIEEICAVDGVDAAFVGPSDLAASMGMIGQVGHLDVVTAVSDALQRITAAGLPAGVYAASPETAKTYADAGASFLAVGVDTYMLARTAKALAESFTSD